MKEIFYEMGKIPDLIQQFWSDTTRFGEAGVSVQHLVNSLEILNLQPLSILELTRLRFVSELKFEHISMAEATRNETVTKHCKAFSQCLSLCVMRFNSNRIITHNRSISSKRKRDDYPCSEFFFLYPFLAHTHFLLLLYSFHSTHGKFHSYKLVSLLCLNIRNVGIFRCVSATGKLYMCVCICICECV